MKVLILTTYLTQGGAAIAATRLAQALRGQGAEVTVMAAKGGVFKGHPWPFIAERLLILAASLFSRRHLWDLDAALFGEDVTRTAAFREADVIHLHWVCQGFVSLSAVARIARSGKRVVWTMHDAWNATGLCHLTLSCRGHREGCLRCPRLPWPLSRCLAAWAWRRKRRLYKHCGIRFVACSQWLRKEALESTLMRDQSVTAIPNAIDTARFFRSEQSEARRALHLPGDKRLLLFVAQNVDNPYKGMSHLAEAVAELADTDVELVMLGGNAASAERLLPGVTVHALGYVRDAEVMRRAYVAADVFVLPSLSENLPNTIMEAMACGTPSVAFRVGGIPEMITDGVTGFTARYRDSHDLALCLARALAAPSMAETCVARVRELYSEEAVARLYLEIYKQ